MLSHHNFRNVFSCNCSLNWFFIFGIIYLTLLKVTDAFWGGGNGGWGGQFGLGGFHSGYGHQGHGYGSGLCAGARQRQGGVVHSPQPVSPYSYNGGYNDNNGYLKNPAPIPSTNLDYRVNIPASRPASTSAPTTCSYSNSRDPAVFSQQCIFPRESVQYSCSSRGDALPVGTTSVTTCKSPEYYSERGDMMLEICKDGKWHGDGKTLTCKAYVIVTQSPVVQAPFRDPVAQYVDNSQAVYQGTLPPKIGTPNAAQEKYYNRQYEQPTWTYNQPVPSSSQKDVIRTQEPMSTAEPYKSPPDWNYNYTNTYPAKSPEYVLQYPPLPYYAPSSTTTTTTEPTTTTTTTTERTTTTTTTTTLKPSYFLENIDWRQYAKYNSSPPYSSSNPNYYPTENVNAYPPQNKQNFDACPPLPSKPGVILECFSKKAQTSNGGSGYLLSVGDCQGPQPVGTEATYKCQMYYEPLTGLPTQYRRCKENGDWTGSDDGFGCKLECGKSNPAGRLPLITFGEMTVLGQWPWHAALFIRDRGDVTNACGATLVGKKSLLTAAHCVNLYLSSLTRDLNDIRVDLGRYHRTKDDPYVQKFQVEKIVTHPAYNPFIFESDIAIIILKDAARIGFHVRPVCFPKSQNSVFDEINLADGSYATVVGWGVDETGENPDELRAAKIRVIGYRECIDSFEEADTGALLAKSTTFCAGNNNGTNVCRGDSGSGAYFPVKTSSGSTLWYLQGIVSLGINSNDKKCDPERVSIFTRVSPYADWINRVLQENDAM